MNPTTVSKHFREYPLSLSNNMKEEISKGEAKKLFEKRSNRSQKIDMSKDAQIMFSKPNKYWSKNTNKVDLYELDGFQPIKVKKKPRNGYPFEIVEYKGELYRADKEGKFSKVKEKTSFEEKIEAETEVKPSERIFQIEKISFKKFTPITVKSLSESLGKGESLSDEEMIGLADGAKYLAKINGYDDTYGLSRSFLNDYGESAELRDLPRVFNKDTKERDIEIGAIIELPTKEGKRLYKRFEEGWKLICEENESYRSSDRYLVYGLKSELNLENLPPNRIGDIAKMHNNPSIRLGAIQYVEDIDTLKEIAINDESFQAKSKAYSRIKEINPNSETLRELREYFSKASKQYQEDKATSFQAKMKLRRETNIEEQKELAKQINTPDAIEDVILWESYETEEKTPRFSDHILETLFGNISRQIDYERIKEKFEKEYPQKAKELFK